jgi:hypothetical protein
MTSMYASIDHLGRRVVWSKAGKYWIHPKTAVVYRETITLKNGRDVIIQAKVGKALASRIRAILEVNLP